MNQAPTPEQIKANDRLRSEIYRDQARVGPKHRKHRNNTSGYRGITKREETGKWVARITVAMRTIYLGEWKTKKEAAAAFEAAEKILR